MNTTEFWARLLVLCVGLVGWHWLFDQLTNWSPPALWLAAIFCAVVLSVLDLVFLAAVSLVGDLL